MTAAASAESEGLAPAANACTRPGARGILRLGAGPASQSRSTVFKELHFQATHSAVHPSETFHTAANLIEVSNTMSVISTIQTPQTLSAP